MSDERFAMYQGHVVESVLENIEKQIASGGRVEVYAADADTVRSSLSGLRSNVIEARDKEFNKHADKRRPVGKRVDTVSKRVKRKKYHTRIQNRRYW